jgi:4-carboxymuconolactone decarboxylase
MTTQNPRGSSITARQATFPKLAEVTDNVVYGDIWERTEQLSKRDRSLITVAALVAMYRTDQLRGHIGRALDNGVTKEEIAEVITHMAFYAGWPTAANAVQVAGDVFDQRGL